MATELELFGSSGCPYTSELREHLEWEGKPFTEYDVDGDLDARRRMFELTGGNGTVPVLVEAGRVIQTGWQGRGCMVAPPDPP